MDALFTIYEDDIINHTCSNIIIVFICNCISGQRATVSYEHSLELLRYLALKLYVSNFDYKFEIESNFVGILKNINLLKK